MAESFIYYSVKIFGTLVRLLPLPVALGLGRLIGCVLYHFDRKHKSQVYANLNIAFAEEKTPHQIKEITKKLYKNYGQNMIELLRLPLLSPEKMKTLVTVEGKEHIDAALAQGKGCLLVAMHFGSWEIASAATALMGYPYKMFVRPQERYSRLDEWLNTLRSCGGQVVLTRGGGTKDFLKALKDNYVVGMVADQGGRDGVLVPFLGRTASMASGAVRIAMKTGVPVCFSVILREKGGRRGRHSRHRMIFHPAMSVEHTDDAEQDVVANLTKIVRLMEQYIRQSPSEYMWFYKIWKYSREADIAILFDGKIGHLRQSQTVAKQLQYALAERQTSSQVNVVRMHFKNLFLARSFSLMSLFFHPLVCQGRLASLKWILQPESYRQISSIKSDFIISCGSSIAGINHLLSMDRDAKSIVILRPGLLSFAQFDLVFLPEHDMPKNKIPGAHIVSTVAAPNLITSEFIKDQAEKLQNRFSHLKGSVRTKIGVLIGGESAHVFVSLHQVKILMNQLKAVCHERNALLLVTTSRRTPASIDQYLLKTISKSNYCGLLILPNREDVPEALGGIMGLADILVVSGDSISMMSEASCSGKKTFVFPPETRAKILKFSHKHKMIIDGLSRRGYIYATDVNHTSQAVYDLLKGKIQTRMLNDNEVILEAVRGII